MNREIIFGKNNKVGFIAKTGIFLALTLVIQYISGLFGQQLLTGSMVNMMLLLCSLYTGLIGAVVVGIFTPFIGFILGFSSNIVLIPFIALSNALYIILFITIRNIKNNVLFDIIGVIIGSVVKYLFLSIFVIKLILPLFMTSIPSKLVMMFGITQLFTALIGGALYIILSKIMSKIKTQN